ncbi:MAG: hypothetical protein FJ308_19950 [Planctomycetes bacterium]|nr:hypothetical protein [Planctomycetota bacterium]
MVTQADIERVQDEIRPQVMVMMVIHVALMLGAGAYAVFVFLSNLQKEVFEDASLEFFAIPIAITVVCTVGSFVIPSLLLGSIKQNVTWIGDPASSGESAGNPSKSMDQSVADTPAKALMGGNMVTRIVGLALLEGPMFLCSFLASLYSPWWLVGSGILLLLMASRFPLPRSLAEWVADEEELLLASRGDSTRTPT